jgi:hypothetical protein
MKPYKMSDQYAKVVQQAYEDGFVQGKIYEQSGRVSCGKTIPEEPQYLYVWKDGQHNITFTLNPPHPAQNIYNLQVIGKIKLETDDE